MKKLILFIVLLIFLVGCSSNKIKPIKVTKKDFNLEKANDLLKRSWKPIFDMTNNYETKPIKKVKSKEEFLKVYKFKFMSSRFKNRVFESLVKIKDGNIVKDKDGYIVFSSEPFTLYIPTIFDKSIVIKNAYIEKRKYSKEYSYLDRYELIIEEGKAKGFKGDFKRKSIYRKNVRESGF
ncbi:MAG: hypothetical protein FH753_16230 [Firmicutes bacterium]|nr:hypothetical protein [Bacillota bacterium]